MRIRRRSFLRLVAAQAAMAAVARAAGAEGYPSRPVRVVVGLPPGNSPDIVARSISQWLSQRLGQAFVVENRPGIATNIATEAVAHAAADGYTLLLVTAGNAINGSVYKNLSFNFLRDFAPVASIGGIPFAMVINPSLPAKTVPEFIDYAKANPGKLLMASAGNASVPHVLGVLFEMMAGVDLVHVPYKDSFFPDLLAGQVHVAFEPVPAVIGFLKSGKLRGLAVTTARRLDTLPDVPALKEFIPGYEGSGWLGIAVLKSTPADIVDRLNKEVNTGLADSELKARLTALGAVLTPTTPAGFETFLVEETEKWAKVVKFANIAAE